MNKDISDTQHAIHEWSGHEWVWLLIGMSPVGVANATVRRQNQKNTMFAEWLGFNQNDLQYMGAETYEALHFFSFEFCIKNNLLDNLE